MEKKSQRTGCEIAILLEEGNIGIVAGTTIKGVVNVNQTEPIHCKELTLGLYGEEKTDWIVLEINP